MTKKGSNGRTGEGKRKNYEAVALGAAGELVGDDDSLQDLAVLLEVLSHGFLGRLPRQPAHEHFGQRRVDPDQQRIAAVVIVNVSRVVVIHCHVTLTGTLFSDRRPLNRTDTTFY